MSMWKNLKSMIIPGNIMAASLTGVLFGITTVLFIVLPISQTNDSTLGENIFGKKGSLKVENVELLANQTGDDTMEALQTLNKTLESWAERISEERSSQSIPPQVESIMKKLNNSSQEEF